MGVCVPKSCVCTQASAIERRHGRLRLSVLHLSVLHLHTGGPSIVARARQLGCKKVRVEVHSALVCLSLFGECLTLEARIHK